jgi:hypothetical protein
MHFYTDDCVLARFQFRTTTLLTIVTCACLTLGFVSVARFHPLPFGIVFGSLLFCLLVMAFLTFGRNLTTPQTVTSILLILMLIALVVWQTLPVVR